jgi:hypothetical protein
MIERDNKYDAWERRKMADLTSQPAHPDSSHKKTELNGVLSNTYKSVAGEIS